MNDKEFNQFVKQQDKIKELEYQNRILTEQNKDFVETITKLKKLRKNED